MNDISIKRALLSMFGCLIIVLSVCGCSSESEREYYDDIIVPLQDSTETLIINEWSYLMGSGIEVYYQKGDADPILLGTAPAGDDGFCPFKEGLYEIKQTDNSVTIKWCFNPSSSNWKTQTFELPR